MLKIESLLQTIDKDTMMRFTLLKEGVPIGHCDVMDPYTQKPVMMNFFVLEKYRNKGYGSMLLEQAEHLIRIANTGKLYLYVNPKSPAVDYYMARSYAFTGEVLNNGDLMMIKAIQ